MAEIVITEFMGGEAVSALGGGRDVLYDPRLGDDRGRLLEALDDTVVIVVRNKTRVDAELLDAAPRLSMVARLGVGLDNIDLEACAGRGVEVIPATGANTDAVAEYVLGAMLLLARKVFGTTPDLVAGGWPRSTSIGHEIGGKTLGLLGFGEIARAVATRAQAMGMDVIAHDPYLDPAQGEHINLVSFGELLATSDFLSVHVPLSADTSGIISADQILSMRPGACLINTSRGGVVDEEALIAALRQRHLGGAALDVFESEPLDAAGGGRFANVPNLILTPHIAGVTVESEQRVGEMTVAAINRHLERV